MLAVHNKSAVCRVNLMNRRYSGPSISRSQSKFGILSRLPKLCEQSCILVCSWKRLCANLDSIIGGVESGRGCVGSEERCDSEHCSSASLAPPASDALLRRSLVICLSLKLPISMYLLGKTLPREQGALMPLLPNQQSADM